MIQPVQFSGMQRVYFPSRGREADYAAVDAVTQELAEKGTFAIGWVDRRNDQILINHVTDEDAIALGRSFGIELSPGLSIEENNERFINWYSQAILMMKMVFHRKCKAFQEYFEATGKLKEYFYQQAPSQAPTIESTPLTESEEAAFLEITQDLLKNTDESDEGLETHDL